MAKAKRLTRRKPAPVAKARPITDPVLFWSGPDGDGDMRVTVRGRTAKNLLGVSGIGPSVPAALASLGEALFNTYRTTTVAEAQAQATDTAVPA